MSEDMKQINFEVDEETYERINRKLSDYGEKSDFFRKCAREKAYGADQTERERIRQKRRDIRSDIQDLQQQRQSIDNDIQEKQAELDRVEERLDTLMENDGEYDGFLQSIEADLHDGMRVYPEHGKIESAAETGDCSPQDVISDLKDRNPNLPDAAFREPLPSETPAWRESSTSELSIVE